MKLCGLLLQAGIIVLVAYVTPSEANGKALKQWVDCATDWSAVTHSIGPAFEFKEVSENIKQSIQKAEVTVRRDEEYNELEFYLKEQQTQLESTANFLHYEMDKAVFLQVNRAMWGFWFGTDMLSGCDIWIAVHEDYDPLIIHINANSIKNPVDNLIYKQNLAKQALDYFNENEIIEEDKYYDFHQRISYDFAKDHEPIKDEIDEYWNNFKVEHNIPYYLYYYEKGQNGVFFYGIYDTCYFTEAWKFALKVIRSGNVLAQFSCSTRYLYCTVL